MLHKAVSVMESAAAAAPGLPEVSAEQAWRGTRNGRVPQLDRGRLPSACSLYRQAWSCRPGGKKRKISRFCKRLRGVFGSGKNTRELEPACVRMEGVGVRAAGMSQPRSDVAEQRGSARRLRGLW